MDYVLESSGLTKRYGGRAVVKDLSMHIRRGDIYGFIGRNGAGKTTFMRLILGLAVPDAGTFSLFGGENHAEAGQKVGSVIEAPAIYAGCTAQENLKRFSLLSNRGSSETLSDREIAERLELVGLGDVGKKKAGHFSLGMRQRLAIAIAMLGDPEFLVMDEPVNGLDPEGIRDVRDTIKRLNHEKGVTFLISSHLLDELSKTVSRYGIIDNGVLLEEIDADELATRFRRNVSLTVNDPGRAIQVFHELLPRQEVKAEGAVVTVFGRETPAAVLNRMLVEHGVEVGALMTQTKDIEDYFIERIGG